MKKSKISAKQKVINKMAMTLYLEALAIREKGDIFLGDIDLLDLKKIKRVRFEFANKHLVELTVDELIEMIKHAKFLYELGQKLIDEEADIEEENSEN